MTMNKGGETVLLLCWASTCSTLPSTTLTKSASCDVVPVSPCNHVSLSYAYYLLHVYLSDEEDAALVYDAAAIKYHGARRRTNFEYNKGGGGLHVRSVNLVKKRRTDRALFAAKAANKVAAEQARARALPRTMSAAVHGGAYPPIYDATAVGYQKEGNGTEQSSFVYGEGSGGSHGSAYRQQPHRGTTGITTTTATNAATTAATALASVSASASAFATATARSSTPQLHFGSNSVISVAREGQLPPPPPSQQQQQQEVQVHIDRPAAMAADAGSLLTAAAIGSNTASMGTNNGTAASIAVVHTSSYTPPTTADSAHPSTMQDTHAGITAAAAATIAAHGLTAPTAFGGVLAGATEGSNSSQPQSSFALDRLPASNTKRATKRSRYPHGVTWNAQRRMWWARVVFDPSSHRDFKGLGQFIPRQTIDLGTFINEDEAAHAHDAAAIEVHGEGAPFNFPAFPAWARIQDREKYAVCHGDMSWQQGFNRVSNGGIARRAGGVGGGAGGAARLNSSDQFTQQQMQPKEPPPRSEFLGVCLAKYVAESM